MWVKVLNVKQATQSHRTTKVGSGQSQESLRQQSQRYIWFGRTIDFSHFKQSAAYIQQHKVEKVIIFGYRASSLRQHGSYWHTLK